MLMLGGAVIAVMLALLIWDLAGQPTGRRWRRRRRRRADAASLPRKKV
ncbi:MAG: hypothetical protein KKA16_02965 [Alphaproteobacteria bacterium]|nr:hypothetical protein [Alphaproteobacteria bacterium]MBU2378517.1 hypothetical protein [Alphaproteobacteria bacterium]